MVVAPVSTRMNRGTKVALAAGAGLLGAWVAWGLWVKRSTERVPYETSERFDGVELRRYPETVLAETTAPDERTAFGRLYRYITGDNEGEASVAMTAPVSTRGVDARVAAPVRGGSTVAMTAPVRTSEAADGVTMAFYLPAEYDPDAAPVPTDPTVRLVVEPPRTVAVRQFSWFATDDRVARQRRALLDALARRGLEPQEDPQLLRYDPPWTPPFLRTNEVAVEVGEG